MCLQSMIVTDTESWVGWYTNILMALGIGFLYLLFTRLGKPSLKLKQVVVADTLEECRNAVSILSRKCAVYPVLGFDCEWVTYPGERHRVALLQLASVDGFCVLIRLSKICESGSWYFPSELKRILEEASILKVGVVPDDDADRLFNDYGLIVLGCLDLRHLVSRNGGMCSGGLGGLSEKILNASMDKSWFIRCSNWEAEELSAKQITYAAKDAWYAVKIFEVLASGKVKISDFSILDWFRAHWLNVTKGTFIPSCVWDYVDIKFHSKITICKERNENQLESSIQSINTIKQKPNKASRILCRAFCTRQTPLYHNCFMQAPDGAVLCTCDKKKAMWYVSKNLAILISEDPLTVRLKFEPSGRAVGTVGQYYVQTKSNCCVVCGRIDECIRKNVVPHEYRRFFPKIMKDHVSHDVLLLCLPCHLRSVDHDLNMRKHLAELCNAPFCQGGNAKLTVIRERNMVKAAARALLRSEEKIPVERIKELRRVVQEFYNATELTDTMLREAATLNTHQLNEDYNPHGLKTVQYFCIEKNGGLVKLERMWREHFLKTMNPKYMPNLWSVTHTEDRLMIRATENRVLPDELCVAGMKDCMSLLELARKQSEYRQTEV